MAALRLPGMPDDPHDGVSPVLPLYLMTSDPTPAKTAPMAAARAPAPGSADARSGRAAQPRRHGHGSWLLASAAQRMGAAALVSAALWAMTAWAMGWW
jgi:hypothetical protein